MNNMNALIIDDEKNQRNVIRQIITKYCPSISIVGEAANIDDAFSLIKTHHPNLIFLDVEMPYGSGFDLLTKFDTIPFEVIFVTGFGHYAVKAFEFNALHFIQKPIDDRAIIQAVARAQARRQEKTRANYYNTVLENLRQPTNPENQIAISLVEGLEFVTVKDIIRCKSDAGNTFIYLSNKKRIFSSKNLKEYQNLLEEDYKFCRVHNSHLINMRHIKKYLKSDGGTVIMSDNSEIPISRRRKEVFLKLLNEMFGGKL